jgi:hypothetical protein
MPHDRVEQAARNNAIWCDTVCRAHGKRGEFRKALWLNRWVTPPFYPNAVTLLGNAGIIAQLESIQGLVDDGVTGGIKDSFHTLDLTRLGFSVLFEAEWLYRSTSLPKPDVEIAGVRWEKINSATELAAWETAWDRDPASERGRVFLPPLLLDESVAILAAHRQQTIVAGAIANCTNEVVGISNVFVPATDPERYRGVCLAKAMEAFPGLPLVAYESGEDLTQTVALGFEAIGALRIWIPALA